MSPLPLDKNAADLNRVLREHGKKLGKTWRIRIRKLLSETFAALSAPKLDGDRCTALGEQIDRELAWVRDPSAISEDALVDAFNKMMGEVAAMQKPTFGHIPGNIEKERPHIIDASDEDAPNPTPKKEHKQSFAVSPLILEKKSETSAAEPIEGVAPEARPRKAKKSSKKAVVREETSAVTAVRELTQSEQRTEDVPTESTKPEVAQDSGDTSSDTSEKPAFKPLRETPPEVGYFDIVSIRIRQFFKFRALVETYEIGQTTTFAEKFCDAVEARIEKFIAVLSSPDDSASHFSTDVVTGYRDDLIKDMPDRDLVLHPKKKKKKQ